MSWLRLDDKFHNHPKVLALTDREFRIHIAVLCYCAEYQTGGKVPTSARKTLNISKRIIERFVTVGLWDDQETVHDWATFNPPKDNTGAERQQRYRNNRNGNVTANITPIVTATHAGIPSRPKELDLAAASTTPRDDPSSAAAADLHELLDRLGVAGALRVAAFADPVRASACARAAIRRGSDNPPGLFRVLLESGETPAGEPVRVPPKPGCPECGVGGNLHAVGCSLVDLAMDINPDSEAA